MKPLPQQQKTTDAWPHLETMRSLPLGYPLGVFLLSWAISFMPLLIICSYRSGWAMLHVCQSLCSEPWPAVCVSRDSNCHGAGGWLAAIFLLVDWA